jgi:hypothetical protein
MSLFSMSVFPVGMLSLPRSAVPDLSDPANVLTNAALDYLASGSIHTCRKACGKLLRGHLDEPSGEAGLTITDKYSRLA